MRPAEFTAIFAAHGDAVFGFAYRMTRARPTAEDVTQDVFIALLEGVVRHRAERGAMRAFLLGIARNLIRRRWREEGRRDLFGDEPQPIRIEPAGQETGALVAQAVHSLPPLQMEALILAEYHGMSLKEIAAAVDAEIGTVKSRLHRARVNLRLALSPLNTRSEVQTP